MGYYLVPLEIPDEYLMDEEMKQLYQEYNEHIDIFKTEHSELEELRHSMPNYAALE